MASIELDHGRLEALSLFTSDELREIAQGVVDGISDALAAIAAGMERIDAETVAQAAHRGRNEALLVGARELDRTFAEIETAARHDRLDDARQAVAAIPGLWRQTRTAIERIPLDVQV